MRMGPRKLQIEHAGLHAPNPVVSRMAQGNWLLNHTSHFYLEGPVPGERPQACPLFCLQENINLGSCGRSMWSMVCLCAVERIAAAVWNGTYHHIPQPTHMRAYGLASSHHLWPPTKKKGPSMSALGSGSGGWVGGWVGWLVGWQKLWFARVNCKILLTCSRLLFGPKLAIKNGLCKLGIQLWRILNYVAWTGHLKWAKRETEPKPGY